MMTLYSSENCLDSHRIRFILAVKGINVEIIHVEQDRSANADLAGLNPYAETPTLVDRDMVLYGTWVVADYLDERYPHPPLMPIDPVSRSRLRLAMYRLQRDWIDSGQVIETSTGAKRVAAAQEHLHDTLVEADDVFGLAPFFLHDELTLIDCALVPLLWRLSAYEIKLVPRQTPNLHRYMERMFRMDAFQRSLAAPERLLRAADKK